jgi:hypothetical protein
MSTPESPAVPLDKLAKTYRKIRDAKAALTAEYDTKIAGLDGQLDVVSDAMKEQMKAAGVTSVKTDEGTVILSKQTRYSVQDWDAFKAFAVEHDALDLFERRIAQKNTEQFLEQNPDVAIPSLMTDAKYVVSVRKPGAK